MPHILQVFFSYSKLQEPRPRDRRAVPHAVSMGRSNPDAVAGLRYRPSSNKAGRQTTRCFESEVEDGTSIAQDDCHALGMTDMTVEEGTGFGVTLPSGKAERKMFRIVERAAMIGRSSERWIWLHSGRRNLVRAKP